MIAEINAAAALARTMFDMGQRGYSKEQALQMALSKVPDGKASILLKPALKNAFSK